MSQVSPQSFRDHPSAPLLPPTLTEDFSESIRRELLAYRQAQTAARVDAAVESLGRGEGLGTSGEFLLTLLQGPSIERKRFLEDWSGTYFLGRCATLREDDALHPSARRGLERWSAGERIEGSNDLSGIAIFKDCRALAVPPDLRGVTNREGLLAFDASIRQGLRLIEEHWPEWLVWIRTLVPAFACLGPPPLGSQSRSESYGPGCPIFLSQVRSALKHAEDIVHEVQHHRFHLWARGGVLPSVHDERCQFVSPYRGDPRPLYGLHLGLHAFVVVNEFRQRLSQACAVDLDSALQIHCGNLYTWATLWRFEERTDDGERYLLEAARLLLAHDEWLAGLLPASAFAEMEQRIQAHALQVGQTAARNVSPELIRRSSVTSVLRTCR